MTTSKQKARAWEIAADGAVGTAPWIGDVCVREHLLNHVVPSMRNRAKIIRRNAPKRTKR